MSNDIKTILVPGVAWPKYKKPRRRTRVIGDRSKRDRSKRDPDSGTGRIEDYIRAHPGLTRFDIAEAHPDIGMKTVQNSLSRLWRTNRVTATKIVHNGHICRLYYVGERK